MYWSNALSSVFHGWVTNLLRDSPEEKSFTLVLIVAVIDGMDAAAYFSDRGSTAIPEGLFFLPRVRYWPHVIYMDYALLFQAG
jgi:hypothetical protein